MIGTKTAKIVGDITMIETPTRQNRWCLVATIKHRDGIENWRGYGNDLKECWLDMFEAFNREHGDTYVVNGKLKGHRINYENAPV